MQNGKRIDSYKTENIYLRYVDLNQGLTVLMNNQDRLSIKKEFPKEPSEGV